MKCENCPPKQEVKHLQCITEEDEETLPNRDSNEDEEFSFKGR